MYTTHFGLKEMPFSIAPDPRYLYMSDRHSEALAHLLYGVGEGGGFVLLTGEVGTGKTTLCRALLEQLPEDVDVAFIFNPPHSIRDLLEAVCDEFEIDHSDTEASPKGLLDRLNRRLLETHADGRRSVLIIDEAQNLDIDVLEQVRLLTNLETPRQKLLQIILIGQPELNAILERKELRQLAQRVTARYHLRTLSKAETPLYIDHRMQIAGRDGTVFTAGAVRKIYSLARGIPRVINLLCDRALLGSYASRKSVVNAGTVIRAASEVLGPGAAPAPRRWLPWLAGAAACALVGVGLWKLVGDETAEPFLAEANTETFASQRGGIVRGEATPNPSVGEIRFGGVSREPEVADSKPNDAAESLPATQREVTPVTAPERPEQSAPASSPIVTMVDESVAQSSTIAIAMVETEAKPSEPLDHSDPVPSSDAEPVLAAAPPDAGVSTTAPASTVREEPGKASSLAGDAASASAEPVAGCYSIGPIASSDETTRTERWLREQGFEPALRVAFVEELDLYGVYVPPLPSTDAAAAKIAELRNSGIRDVVVLRKGEYQNAISVGMYGRKEWADRRVEQLGKLGYKTKVITRHRTTEMSWLDLAPKSGETFPGDEFAVFAPEVNVAAVGCKAAG